MHGFPVSDYGVVEFYTQYLNPTKLGGKPPSHDGLAFIVNPQKDIFDFLTEKPIPPKTDSLSTQQVRTMQGFGYLGRLNYSTFQLKLDERNYNNGNPTDQILADGFRRLAELFCVDIPVK